MDFVGSTVTELLSRGKNSPSTAIRQETFESLAGNTLWWFDAFVEFFNQQRPGHADDILYFVRDTSTKNHHHEMQEEEKKEKEKEQGPIFVRRRTGELPPLTGFILWEETFYLNLLAQLQCQIRISVVKESSAQQIVKRVYAEPLKGPGQDDSCAYPMINFPVHSDEQLALSPGQKLCVELCAIFKTDQEQEEVHNRYEPWKTTKERQPLFQGAVTYPALLSVHHRKVGIRVKAPSKVVMQSPNGKGFAMVNVVDAQARFLKVSDLLKRVASKETHSSGQELECSLGHIYIDWRHIVRDLYRHFNRQPSQDVEA